MSDDDDLPLDDEYDSFLREAAQITGGARRAALVPLRAGTRLADDRFEIERTLGSGGMGVVYAAFDHQRGCRVAVKTLRVTKQDDRHRLHDEFLVLQDLAPHPNLVALDELFDDGDRCFFSMELVDGVPFLSHVRPDDALDVARLRAALAQLAAGLGFLHGAGKVHHDVKPSNVLCSAERVVLLDFGLASGGGDSARKGTLPYMAPEQHAGATTLPAADWYAVGVMLWTALAGRLPFAGKEHELVNAKLRGPSPIDGAAAGTADLVELAMALLDPEPARRPPDDAILARLGAPALERALVMPFVGRGDELGRLHAAWVGTQARTSTVLVRGPSGVGKSALLARFADEVRAGGAIVLVGRCHERVAMPYKAMHGIASALAAHLRQDREARSIAVASPDVGLLPQVFPALGEIKELAGTAEAGATVRDPQQRRSRVFDAFAELVARLAAHAPLAMMIDDLQWADRDSLALVQHIATVPAGVLVVAAARDGELDAEAAWLAEGSCVELGGLARDDAEELARRLAGVDEATAIAREATGHPLHIAELARRWRPGHAAPHLDDAIAQRVADLPAEDARVLELVVIGGPLSQAVIGEAARLDGATRWRALAALRAANLVRTHGPASSDLVEPYHDRVRETVAGRLAREVVVDHHLRLAEALEALEARDGAERPDLLAHHFEGAARPARAAQWAERAGDQAAQALAFERAAELYQRALALTAHPPAHARTLHTRLGDALVNAGRGSAAATAYLAGAALVTGDAALELRRRAAEQLLRSGHIDEGLRVLDGVLADVGLPPASHRRWPLASLVIQRALLGVRRWRGPARRPGSDDDRRRLACCVSAVVGLAMSSPMRMAEYQTRQLRLALAAREPRRIALGICVEAAAQALAGAPPARAAALLRDARTWAAEADGWNAEPYLALAEGTVAFLYGRWRDTLARCDVVERMFRDEYVGVAWEIGTARQLSLSSLWQLGRIGELRPRLVRALEEVERSGDRYAATELHTRTQPMVHLMDDREPAAREVLARAWAGLARRQITLQHWHHLQQSTLVELYAGAPHRAVELLERGLPTFPRVYAARNYLMRSNNAYHLATAWLGALADGAPEPPHVRTSILGALRDLDAYAVTRPIPLLVGAGLAVLRGDLGAATARYRAAAAGYEAADMALHAAAARWRLGELVGGDEGRALVAQATVVLSTEGIARPDRVVAMFAPVPPDARRSGIH